MKTPRLLAVLTLFTAGSVAFAADAAPAAPAPEAHAKEKKPETELTKKMDKIGGAFRKLKKQAGDATKNAESLQLVATMRQYAAEAAKLEPFKATEVPEADRAKLIAGYKEKMDGFNQGLYKLEEAFKSGNNAVAVQIIQELGNMQKEGHKEYKSKSID